MSMLQIYAFIATIGPIGYLMAPGTLATCITLPLAFWLQTTLINQINYGIFLAFFFIISRIIVNKAREHFGRYHDPAEIVLDEVLGCLITFWGISFSTPAAIFGFLIFRFFDITKIGGISYFEKFNNGWGIMLDDVMAALISNIILRLLFS